MTSTFCEDISSAKFGQEEGGEIELTIRFVIFFLPLLREIFGDLPPQLNSISIKVVKKKS